MIMGRGGRKTLPGRMGSWRDQGEVQAGSQGATYRGPRNTRRAFWAKESSRSLH